MLFMPGRIKLANLPTPIERLERISNLLVGPQIYIKRDDFTGSEISGNKVRKLEFTVGEALEQGADMLITCGGLQSNHARATAAAAAKMGLSSYLILRGAPKEEHDGNYLLDMLLGAQMKFITPEQYSHEINEIFEKTSKELSEQGYKPYIIPEGASNGIGTFGYAKAVEEITLQEEEMGIKFNKIVIAVGSGGTYAGLYLGSKLLRQEREIYGVNVCDNAEYFVNRIDKTLQEANKYLKEDIEIRKEEIRILDGYVGPGYGLNTQEQLETIKTVARLEGIILDPVYTGKAMHGLAAEIKRGDIFKPDDKVLFIHTGGHFGLFPVKERF